MGKRVNPKRIKQNLTYTIAEASEELDVSVATIRNWIKQGLPIEKGQRPFLVYGVDLREFIRSKSIARKYKLADGELGCFACKASRPPLEGVATHSPVTAKTGRLAGICSVCGGKCSRIVSNTQLSEFSNLLEIHFNDGSDP